MFHGYEMGPGEKDAHRRLHLDAPEYNRGKDDALGHDRAVQGAIGDNAFSRDKTHGTRVFFPSPADAPGHRTTDGGRAQGLEDDGSAQPVGHLGLLGHVHATRSTTEGPVGSADRAADGQEESMVEPVLKVLKVRLGNKGNHWYSNVLLKCLWMTAARSVGPEKLFPPKFYNIVKLFFQGQRISYVWGNPFWRTLLGEWQAPNAQHDIAEFLLFVVQKCPEFLDTIGAHWEARKIRDSAAHVSDRGCSAPLGLLPPPPSEECVTVQQLVDLWHGQDHAHALLASFDNLVLQAGRFNFDSHTGASQKLKYRIEPSRIIEVPVFVSDLQTRTAVYKLNSYALHLGETFKHGHFKAMMLVQNAFHVLDDNVLSRVCPDDEFHDSCNNSYLFFYHRIGV